MAKVILDVEINGGKAISTIDELNKAIKEQNELLKKARLGSEEYNKAGQSLDKLKNAHKQITVELKKEEQARQKMQRTAEKESAKRRQLIRDSQLEGKTNDELRRKLNAMINLRDKYTARGSATYNKLTASVVFPVPTVPVIYNERLLAYNSFTLFKFLKKLFWNFCGIINFKLSTYRAYITFASSISLSLSQSGEHTT